MKGNKPIRSNDDFLVFGRPLIEKDEIEEVVDTLRSGWIGTGPKVAKFEEIFKVYKGSKYAVALNSCTAAMHLACLSCGIGNGNEVITTAMTFCSTVNAIIHSGATPVLVDCDKDTMNIIPEQIEEKITDKTKAILPVHFGGRPCDMDAIMSIARKHNLIVIEDCAHAIESEYKGRKTGTFGDFGCFSFYVTKNIITGEGGMVITDSTKFASKIKVLALHGMNADAWKRFSDEGYKHYLVTECGYKYNMMDLQASIGLHQFKKIHKFWIRRKEIWNKYNIAFQELPLVLPKDPDPNTTHSYHLYTILINEKEVGMNRDQFLEAMKNENIGVGVHYLSIPEHPFYRKSYGFEPNEFPNAYEIGKQTVSLPISPKLSDKDVSDVIEAVKKIIKIAKVK